jgi:hypothetical protein
VIGCPHRRHELVRRDVKPARLTRDERARAERLIEEKGLVVKEPRRQPVRAVRVEVANDRLDLLERMEEVELEPAQVALRAPEPEALLLARRLDVHDLPLEPASADARACE